MKATPVEVEIKLAELVEKSPEHILMPMFPGVQSYYRIVFVIDGKEAFFSLPAPGPKL